MNIPPLPEPGQVIHFLHSGLTYHRIHKGQFTAFVSRRGDELTITEELLDANRDRHGVLAPWLGLLHNPEAQMHRWERIVVAVGPFPSDLLRTEPGDPDHDDARRAAVRDAKQIKDKVEQRAALQAIEKTYGPAQSTSKSLAAYSR